MTTPNLFTSSAPAQSYTAVNGGMDGADQTEGQALYQQASQRHQPDVLVKRQFEQRNQKDIKDTHRLKAIEVIILYQ